MVESQPPLIHLDFTDNFQAAIDRAAKTLRAGGVIAYPTETFYGLAVDIRNEKAVERLFSVKKRPPDNPVLIVIASDDLVKPYVTRIPRVARRLMNIFWPGNLTLVFDAAAQVSSLLTGRTGKIGIRLSSHPVPTSLAGAMDGAISGTSANVSGQPSCRNARDVLKCLGREIDMILDAGETAGRIGSTVIDVTVDPIVLLREGVISRDQLESHHFTVR